MEPVVWSYTTYIKWQEKFSRYLIIFNIKLFCPCKWNPLNLLFYLLFFLHRNDNWTFIIRVAFYNHIIRYWTRTKFALKSSNVNSSIHPENDFYTFGSTLFLCLEVCLAFTENFWYFCREERMQWTVSGQINDKMLLQVHC